MKNLPLLQLLLFLPLLCFGQAAPQITKYWFPAPAGGGYYSYPELVNRSFLKIDPKGNKWVGFRLIGLGKFNNGKWTIYNNTNSGLPSNDILSMDWKLTNAATGSFTYYIGTSSGLVIWDGKTWIVINAGNSSLPSDRVNAVKVVGSAIWLGTAKGVAKFQLGQWTIYNKAGGALPDDEVLSLEVDKSKTVYAGTKNGLAQFANGTWTTYTTANSGLQRDRVDKLLADKHGSLWILTEAIEKPSPWENTTKVYSNLFRLRNNKIESVQRIYNGCNYLDLPSLSNLPMCLNNDGYLTVLGGATETHGYNKYPAIVELLDGEVKSTRFNKTVFRGPCGLDVDAKGNFWLYSAPIDGLSEIDPTGYDKLKFHGTEKFISTLDINNVKANILNRGDMFWDLVDAPAYEVPKGSCKNALFASALWVGGFDGDNLHLAAQTYRKSGNDFYAGPIDTNGLRVSPGSEQKFERLWKLNLSEIQDFKDAFSRGDVSNGTYTIPEAILTWPAHGDLFQSRNLAPFVDTDKDGVYDPMKGDYPKIKGHQMIYWIFNDVAHDHYESGSLKMGVEVHACAYAFNCPDLKPGDSNEVLNYTTFYEYKIINRSSKTYKDAYVGAWVDADLGNPWDDLSGADTMRNMVYTYNSDNYDDLDQGGYGDNPPMLSYVVLDGPDADTGDGRDNNNNGTKDETGERCLLNGFIKYNNDFSQDGNPEKAIDYYFYLTNRYKTGGYRQKPNAQYYNLPGQPKDSASFNNLVMSAGPFTMEAGETNWLRYAIVYSRDEKNPNGMNTSVALNKRCVERVAQWFKTGKFPACVQSTSVEENDVQAGISLQLYPNPSSGRVFLGYSPRSSAARATIMDISGRELMQITLTSGRDNGVDVSGLSAGMYLLRVQDGDMIGTASFVKE